MKLGNLIERFTYYTGIKWIVKKVFGNDCGCKERQDKYNKISLWDQRIGKIYLITLGIIK